jgi:hypothetical protein
VWAQLQNGPAPAHFIGFELRLQKSWKSGPIRLLPLMIGYFLLSRRFNCIIIY